MSQNKILYLSYDGILEPLGYSQVFKYVEKLSKDFDISIVSFEKSANVKDTKNYEKVRGLIQKKGIKWIKHKYHHKPQVPSTIYDLIVLTKTMLIQRLFYGANIIHLRGYPTSFEKLSSRNLSVGDLLLNLRKMKERSLMMSNTVASLLPGP